MVMSQSDLLASYEKDFTDCMALLKKVVDDDDPSTLLEKN